MFVYDEPASGQTLYAYVEADPINWVDPYGAAKTDPNGSSGGAEHKSNQTPSNKGKHEQGQANKKKSRGGEKGDKNRGDPRKKPKGWKGPWPSSKIPGLQLLICPLCGPFFDQQYLQPSSCGIL